LNGWNDYLFKNGNIFNRHPKGRPNRRPCIFTRNTDTALLCCHSCIGTTPLTIGIPTDEEFDFVIDCATSITQNGKIEYYERIGEDVHPGTIIGRDGKEISGDAGEALKKIRSGDAALTTLGGIVRLSADIRAMATLWLSSFFLLLCRTVITVSSQRQG